MNLSHRIGRLRPGRRRVVPALAAAAALGLAVSLSAVAGAATQPAEPAPSGPVPAGPAAEGPASEGPAAPGTSRTGTGLVGWAAENGGTTGGEGGATVRVTSAAALAEAVNGPGPAVVEVQGTIALPDMTRVASDKTIVGVGADATITGGGFTLRTAKNVIIRNLSFDDWDDDAINIEQESTNIWVDHNSFGIGFDGAVDIKRGSDFVTVSWNRVTGHNKVMLLGHSDGNGAQDTGHLRVTYHHNFFEGTTQRTPRVRFGNPVHVFNNLYQDVSGFGVASTEGAGVLVEGNSFVNVPDPFHLGEAASGPGTLVARDNLLVGSGEGQSGGAVAELPYQVELDPADQVKALVTAGAGAGKL